VTCPLRSLGSLLFCFIKRMEEKDIWQAAELAAGCTYMFRKLGFVWPLILLEMRDEGWNGHAAVTCGIQRNPISIVERKDKERFMPGDPVGD
jgi:hypothetical protein